MDAINEFQSLEELSPIGPADFEQEQNCKILPYRVLSSVAMLILN